MKRLSITFLVTFCMFLTVFAGAADVNTGLNDDVIVAGEPPVTGYVIDCHNRILEFVLGTRMTVAQKEAFLNAITAEVSGMAREDRDNFVQVIELVDSLSQLGEEDQEEIRQDLEKDFLESAAALTDDAAAKQFLALKNDSFKLVVDQAEFNVTNQSVEALSEYLAFVANPEKPVWPDAKAIDAIKIRVKAGFAALKDEERQALDDFQLTWYLIRAAWQGTADVAKKDAWRKGFAALGLKAGEVPEVNQIKAAISTDVYGDMLDAATQMGVEPLEWSASTTQKIW
ncbi:hypothetical protein MASR1M12_02540 [Erysipelotrichia bacterium]